MTRRSAILLGVGVTAGAAVTPVRAYESKHSWNEQEPSGWTAAGRRHGCPHLISGRVEGHSSAAVCAACSRKARKRWAPPCRLHTRAQCQRAAIASTWDSCSKRRSTSGLAQPLVMTLSATVREAVPAWFRRARPCRLHPAAAESGTGQSRRAGGAPGLRRRGHGKREWSIRLIYSSAACRVYRGESLPGHPEAAAHPRHNCSLARRAPSAMAWNLAHTTVGWISGL